MKIYGTEPEQVIHALDEGAPSVDRMDTGIVACKRRIQVFEQNGRFQDMISDAQAWCFLARWPISD